MTLFFSIKVTEKKSYLHKNGHFKRRKTLSSNKKQDASALYFSFRCVLPINFNKEEKVFKYVYPSWTGLWQNVETLTRRKNIF